MSNPTPEIVGSQKAYEEFLSEAEALADADVRPFRADGSLALHNVEMGLDAISPHADRIKAELPTVDVVALQELPDLALAVIYAAAQVDRTSDGSTGALIEKARASRTLLLASSEALAVAGILPAHEAERIRAGTGPIDLAQDNVDLAALLTKHATAIAGKRRSRRSRSRKQPTWVPSCSNASSPRVRGARIRRSRLWRYVIDSGRCLRCATRSCVVWECGCGWTRWIDSFLRCNHGRCVGKSRKTVEGVGAGNGPRRYACLQQKGCGTHMQGKRQLSVLSQRGKQGA
ncbi:MAG: hypothetical protein IPM54_33415 [Polyangiaceae bacterium]|nr:hypothetical protein [Polyangiaceae bacterium]